ncbi:hypothetical protein NEMIN01_0432 [Nematocida minor]|uniref:uncharacterized protein n=1 Tax=Nematocida minor TaxID=1912983 RepID=UPI00221E8DBC|nr:uncharacterized protein NEMIN01_0432 [Nematocida minor]KAI5189369.1 hypothetical protein NEMIN01_0432 [Nematocida minor]
MLYSGITHVETVPVEEDIQREKAFVESTMQVVNILATLKGAHIPLVIHPGKRVKSKKEMRDIEENLVESRKPQKVSFKKPSRQERRKKDQVEEKIKSAMALVPEGERKNKKFKKDDKKKGKKQRLGKNKRQKMSHRK